MVWECFAEARKFATRIRDERTYYLGAYGIRADSARVRARNGAALYLAPEAHAEVRLCRKLDRGAVVYVARISRIDGGYRIAKPCANCRKALKQRGVSRVYYTIGPNEYGVIDFDKER